MNARSAFVDFDDYAETDADEGFDPELEFLGDERNTAARAEQAGSHFRPRIVSSDGRCASKTDAACRETIKVQKNRRFEMNLQQLCLDGVILCNRISFNLETNSFNQLKIVSLGEIM